MIRTYFGNHILQHITKNNHLIASRHTYRQQIASIKTHPRIQSLDYDTKVMISF